VSSVSQPQRKLLASSSDVGLGLITIVVVLALVVMSFTGSLASLFGGPAGHTITAVFADAQQLHSGDPVRIGGLTVGKVESISLDRGARHSTVTMTVDSSAGPLYADATAAVDWRTALGSAFVVSLSRGTSSAGPLASGQISQSRTSDQVELEDITSIDQAGAKQGLQTMPGQLAQALGDRNALATALQTLARISPSAAVGLDATRGQVPDSDLRKLISATSATVQALDTPFEDLRGAVAGGATTLGTTAAHATDLRNTISQAPGVLADTSLTLRQLDTTLGLADPLIAHLLNPARQVAPTVSQLEPTVTGADRLLRHATPLVNSLRPAVSSLAHTARQGVPLLTDLTPSLDRLDQKILPSLNQVDPGTKHTTAEMIGPTFAGLGPGIAGAEDNLGHILRFPASSGSSPAYLPCQIYVNNPDKHSLIECESLQQALSSLLSYNPLQSAATAKQPPR
jgi:phospholipid/cholesterol/gamma-HCH transport system substrate-binding protein